jgi:hypothetical protein
MKVKLQVSKKMMELHEVVELQVNKKMMELHESIDLWVNKRVKLQKVGSQVVRVVKVKVELRRCQQARIQ